MDQHTQTHHGHPKRNKHFESALTKSAHSIALHASSLLLGQKWKQETSRVLDVAAPARLGEAASGVRGNVFFLPLLPLVSARYHERSSDRCFWCWASGPSPSLSGVSRLVGPGAEAVHLPIWHQAEWWACGDVTNDQAIMIRWQGRRAIDCHWGLS